MCDEYDDAKVKKRREEREKEAKKKILMMTPPPSSPPFFFPSQLFFSSNCFDIQKMDQITGSKFKALITSNKYIKIESVM